jgi:D-cysteine desulfhydrase
MVRRAKEPAVTIDTTWATVPALRGLLAVTPTPLQAMDRLAAAIGKPTGTLYVKRDDLTGLAGGGNKARKLEYLCADAVEQGCDWLVSGGGPQSNHARMTAAAAARLGMGCSLLLQGAPPAAGTGNLLLDRLFGAEIVWTPGMDFDAAEIVMHEHAAELARDGHRPYVVPTGGSTALGSLGMADSMREVLDELPSCELVVVATGSGGTHAGLALGAGGHDRVLGFRVAVQADLAERVAAIAAASARRVGCATPSGEVHLDNSQLGSGYGRGTPECFEAIALTARTEGIVLDPVYTGKAMAGLIAQTRDGRIPANAVVVFLHTGGMPGLLSDVHASWLSRELEAQA